MNDIERRSALQRLVWGIVLCGVLLTALALAAEPKGFDKTKAAAAMAQQASAAFEAADYARAAELYLAANQSHPDPLYLYGAGRAEHLAGKRDAAEGHLRQFLAAQGVDAERQQRARTILAEIENAKLDQRVSEGETVAKSGDLRLAAQLWADVARQAPERFELNYKAAVAYQQAGDLKAALAQLDTYLRLAGPGAANRSQAQLRREAIVAKIKAESTTAQAGVGETVHAQGTEPDPVVRRTQPVAASTWPQWTLLGGGVALGLGGLGVYLATLSDIDSFNADTKVTGGKIAKISYAEADRRGSSIRNREALAWGLGGAGIVCAGVGTWMWLHSDAKVAWTPGPTALGTGLAWRF